MRVACVSVACGIVLLLAMPVGAGEGGKPPVELSNNLSLPGATETDPSVPWRWAPPVDPVNPTQDASVLGVHYSYGCDKPEGLTGLKKAMDRALEPEGIMPERRDFSPHFTLGRIKKVRSAAKLARLIEQYNEHTFCLQDVERLILYESILRPPGPEYIPLQTWELAATS